MRKRVVEAIKRGTFIGCKGQTLEKSLCHFWMRFALPYTFGLKTVWAYFSILRSFFPQINSLCPERVDENWNKAVGARNKKGGWVPCLGCLGWVAQAVRGSLNYHLYGKTKQMNNNNKNPESIVGDFGGITLLERIAPFLPYSYCGRSGPQNHLLNKKM